jgi:hypothetical protein
MTPPLDPDLPKDPAAYRRRPLLGVGFWALIAFSVLCVLAGVGVTYLGPRLLPRKPHAPAPAAAPQLPPPTPGPAQPTAAVAPPAPPAEIERLQARIALLETQGARSTKAAAAALAAAGVVEASRSSRPFARDVAQLREAAPDLPELAALARLAETGAPSRPALAASFPDFAARAAVKARKPADDAGFGPRLLYAVSTVVRLRRVDDLAGRAPDALLARAELALNEGDVAAALALLDGLPPAARRALEPWRVGAERRAEIDRLAEGLRAHALQDLTAERAGA